MAGYAKPDALVETDWLEEHLKDPGIRVIEVDEDTEAYEKGHIDGAVGWNWTTDLHAKVGRDYVDQAELSELLSAAGVGPDTTVILYGGNNNWFAAYAYWVLKLRGFDNVKLLNGGRKKWELESRQLTQDPASMTPSGLSDLRPERGEIRALRDEVLGKVGARRGSSTSAHRKSSGARSWLPRPPSAGAGPGAGAHRRRANIPWAKAANEDGTFKSADELRACTRARASPTTARSSRTAGSASARATRGSPCRSCSGTRTSRTTTARGPSTAPSWAHRSRRDDAWDS